MKCVCFWLLIVCIIVLNGCEDFRIFDSRTNTSKPFFEYSLLTISQLNDPGIRALLIQTYNDLGGLRIGEISSSFIATDPCFSTSSSPFGNVFLSIDGMAQIVTKNNAQSDGVFTMNDVIQFRDGINGTIRTTLNDYTTWTTLSCQSLDNSLGIFGKGCDINNQVTLTQPGIYSYIYSSNEVRGELYSNRAKYRIRFTINHFTCYAPTITVKTFMNDYNDATEELLVTYIANISSLSSVIVVDRCGHVSPFCNSTSRPGSNCNIPGRQGNSCDRYVSCPQYYTPTSSWTSGSDKEFIVSNGIGVDRISCGPNTMNIEFILSCATELVQITDGNASYTS